MAAANNADVAQAAALVKTFSADATRRWEAMSREKFLRDQITRETVAHEEGLAEGLAEGRAEGLAEGRAEGRDEERRKTIRALVAEGMPVERVATVLGSTPDEVNATIAR